MSTLQTIQKLLSPIKHAKRWSFLQGFVLATRPLQSIIAVRVMKKITEFVTQGDIQSFKTYITFFGIYIVTDKIFQYVTRDRTRVRMQETYQKIIFHEYIPKFLQLDTSYTDKKGTGYMLSLIEKGVDLWADAIRDIFRYGTGLLITVAFVVYSFSSLQRYLSLGFYSAIIISIILVLYISRYLLPMRKQEGALRNQISRFLVKILMSKIEILQQNTIFSEVEGIKKLNDDMIALKSKRSGTLVLMYIVPELFINLMKFVVFFVVGYGIFEGNYNIGDFILMIGAINIMETAVNEFTTFYKDLQTNFAKITNMWDVIDNGPQHDIMRGSPFQFTSGSIVLQKISFSYEDSKIFDTNSPKNNIFEEFSLDIQSKKKTALVGPSGGGKSTLIKLIAGYLRPDAGDIEVDGQKLSDISLLSYYKHIGYLTQEPNVFDGTIRENLEYGIATMVSSANLPNPLGQEGPGTSDGLFCINDVIKISKCERIYDLPNGLDTEIGERGVRLSGGQKQRLAIAKIMLKNPDIILLDEPTSALDSSNEQAVTEALNNLFQGKTVIIIAHRLQTVKHADDIIYISDGKVIERGNHEELLALKGEYYSMVELQSGF